MTLNTKRKTRKRRSFWEPDSKDLVAWLNNQADLGKSLQLIIVDAMREYGSGDAVDAYLQRRLEGEPTARPKQQPADTPVLDGVPIVDHTPTPPVTETAAEDIAPAPIVNDVADEPAPVVQADAEAPEDSDTQTDRKPPQKVTREPESDEEYDPLAVMFADIDSDISH